MNLLQGDLGQTIFDQPVLFEVKEYLLRSLLLIGIALSLSIPLGIAKGILDFRHANRKTNFLANGTTALVQSLLDFMIIIGVQWGLMELMDWGFPHFSVYMADDWYSFILPSVLLTLFPIAYLARITSLALGTQEKQLYILFARAKGVSEQLVLWKHMLRNSWSMTLDHFPSMMTVLLSNLLLVEYLTQFKGGAYRLYQAVGYHDTGGFNHFRIGDKPPFEADLIIVILFLFMLLILLIKILCTALKYFLDPLWREEK